MRDVLTAAGMLLVLGALAWYAGAVLLRLAAFGWFVFAGVGLVLAGQGGRSARAPVACAGLRVGCWAAGHVHWVRRGWWATPVAARVFSRRMPRRRRRLPEHPRGVAHGRAR